MKQLRGCSRFFGATRIIGEDGTITYGTPFKIAPVKNISRTIEETSEEVWADNEHQYDIEGGTAITREFEITNLTPENEALLMGLDVIDISTDIKGYATPAFSNKPFLAIGYALHDGDPESPSELVWAFKAKVTSISKASATIRRGETTSTSRTISITFYSPETKFTTTGKRNLDFSMPVTPDLDFEKFFEQVVTPDNAKTVFATGV